MDSPRPGRGSKRSRVARDQSGHAVEVVVEQLVVVFVLLLSFGHFRAPGGQLRSTTR